MGKAKHNPDVKDLKKLVRAIFFYATDRRNKFNTASCSPVRSRFEILSGLLWFKEPGGIDLPSGDAAFVRAVVEAQHNKDTFVLREKYIKRWMNGHGGTDINNEQLKCYYGVVEQVKARIEDMEGEMMDVDEGEKTDVAKDKYALAPLPAGPLTSGQMEAEIVSMDALLQADDRHVPAACRRHTLQRLLREIDGVDGGADDGLKVHELADLCGAIGSMGLQDLQHVERGLTTAPLPLFWPSKKSSSRTTATATRR